MQKTIYLLQSSSIEFPIKVQREFIRYIPMHENENTSNILTPTLIYISMGIIVARIALDGMNMRGLTWLEWLQFLVKAGSIVLLWPLVLFLEKFKTWLKSSEEDKK